MKPRHIVALVALAVVLILGFTACAVVAGGRGNSNYAYADDTYGVPYDPSYYPDCDWEDYNNRETDCGFTYAQHQAHIAKYGKYHGPKKPKRSILSRFKKQQPYHATPGYTGPRVTYTKPSAPAHSAPQRVSPPVQQQQRVQPAPQPKKKFGIFKSKPSKRK